MDSIYWVVSRDCNQKCPHCYNDSEPGAPSLRADEISRCVAHLPDPDDVPISRIILSGGEVLAWTALLFHTLQQLHERYLGKTAVWVQTNGDLLDAPTLDRLLDEHVRRVDVSSMDRFHPRSTLDRLEILTQLFESRGMVPATGTADDQDRLTFGFWGATEDQWIGPLWPRGRARQKGLSAARPEHEFCRMWSGARNFLDYRSEGSEVNIQLDDVYPCCPMTCRPIGRLLDEPLIQILDRCAHDPVLQALNQGRPEAMGESLGISEEYGLRRTRELGNHCLWCDEFFTKHALDRLAQGGRTERGIVDIDLNLEAIRRQRPAPEASPLCIAVRPIVTEPQGS